jgi:hypothetical protein
VALVLVCAVTPNVCAATVAPPETALNVKLGELKVSTAGVAVTFSVTVAVCVVDPAVIVIVPVHVVPAANPVWFTEIVKLVLVVLAVKFPVGDMLSQLLPVHVVSVTCAVALMLLDAATPSDCVAGADPPATALKVNAEELNAIDTLAPAVTSRVTSKYSNPRVEDIVAVLV